MTNGMKKTLVAGSFVLGGAVIGALSTSSIQNSNQNMLTVNFNGQETNVTADDYVNTSNENETLSNEVETLKAENSQLKTTLSNLESESRPQLTEGIKVFLNDTQLSNVTGFIYNSEVYIPSEVLAKAVNQAYMWDGKEMSVYFGKHSSDKPSILLKDLDYFNSSESSGAFSTVNTIQDNLGNSYYDVVKLYGREWNEYRINGQYSSLKGVVALPYESRATSRKFWFKVYGDGNLLYTSPELTGGIDPIPFDIDITGVLTLKIESDHSNNDYSSSFYLVNTGLYQ